MTAVPVTRLPRMPAEKFIVGANHDAVAGTARALRLLNDLKYRNPGRCAACRTHQPSSWLIDRTRSLPDGD